MHGQNPTAQEHPEHTEQHTMVAQSFLARKSDSAIPQNSVIMRENRPSIASKHCRFAVKPHKLSPFNGPMKCSQDKTKFCFLLC